LGWHESRYKWACHVGADVIVIDVGEEYLDEPGVWACPDRVLASVPQI
jgi:hypothetical protein